ncbi:hypothetical protein BDV26DRAFT_267755 [Aspergillus bertholletiae]|uniref:Uncharacterized protein n=1 Tax=Aspergillus bertholletiae TaxID=1226010 RepID=A0A5N7B056_9EURO|nr:hypothetical protein BDV26DRAFT_267755 [Aspergillus bertholletiae]
MLFCSTIAQVLFLTTVGFSTLVTWAEFFPLNSNLINSFLALKLKAHPGLNISIFHCLNALPFP